MHVLAAAVAVALSFDSPNKANLLAAVLGDLGVVSLHHGRDSETVSLDLMCGGTQCLGCYRRMEMIIRYSSHNLHQTPVVSQGVLGMHF